MNWTDEDIDDIFKEASLQQKVPVYQDSYFDEIEGLLPRQKKRRSLFGLFGTLTILAIASIHFFTFNTFNKTNKNSLTAVQLQNQSGKLSGSTTTISATNSISSKQLSAINSPARSNSGNIENTGTDQELTTGWDKTGKVDYITPKNKRANKGSKRTKQTKSGTGIDTKNPEFKLPLVTSNEIHPQETETNTDPESKTDNTSDPDRITSSNLSAVSVANYLPQLEQELHTFSFPQKSKKHFFNVELGAGFSESFITSENGKKPMLTANLGVNYEYRSKNNLCYTAGVAYVNHQTNNLQLNRSSVVYGFDVTKYSQTIDYKWISQVQIPLSVGKQFNKQSFSIGLAPSYIIGSTVQFTKIQNGEVIEDSRIHQNPLGLKKFGLSAQITYELKLNQKYAFGVKISDQLINPLDEKKFVGNINKFPFQAQISLKKYITFK